MSSPDTNHATEIGADPAIPSVAPEPAHNHSGTAQAPAVPVPFNPQSAIRNPQLEGLAYRMISRFAIENLRQAADALEAEMPELARHHAHKALEQIDHLQSL